MTTPDGVEEYLAALADGPRAALDRLRAVILSAAPGATETIAYQIPTVQLDGRSLVGYAAFTNHCSLFPMSGRLVAEHREAVAPYLSGKSTLRFTVEEPLPEALVTMVVKARIAENAARRRR